MVGGQIVIPNMYKIYVEDEDNSDVMTEIRFFRITTTNESGTSRLLKLSSREMNIKWPGKKNQ